MNALARGLVAAPFRTSVALQVLSLVLAVTATVLVMHLRSAGWVADTAGDLASAAMVLVLIAKLGWWRKAGVVGGDIGSLPGWALALLPAVAGTCAYGLAFGVRPTSVVGLLVAPAIAVDEELLNRGLILAALLPAGTLRAVILSSVLFGLSHLPNAFDAPLAAVGVQAFGAACDGALWAAIRLRTGSIWPAVAGHALVDLSSGYIGPRLTEASAALLEAEIVLGLASAVVAGILLRHYISDGHPADAAVVPAGLTPTPGGGSSS